MPSGFTPDDAHVYVITNKHVIRGGATVVRLTTVSGETDILDLVASDWVLDPSHDLAACNLSAAKFVSELKLPTMWTTKFVTKDIMREFNLGAGDDCFMIGRFINRDGAQVNTPTVRFGHIAMMPREMVPCDGREEISFLVEVKSISGYSGSPVFVYQMPTCNVWLLGVNWCYFHNRIPVRDGTTGEQVDNLCVDSNTGMAGVIPAWVLRELLDAEPFKLARDKIEQDLAKKRAESGVTLT
jgi:hypothetical protein